MQGLVTVFGGTGFLGRHTVRALARAGWRVRVACRRPHLAPELRVMGDVGQIELVQANVRVPGSLDRALEGAEAVVYLVGTLWEHGPQKFEALHVDGPRAVAQAAAAAGVGKLAVISAIGADASSPSKYARTKADGEAAVREAFPTATIVRPSVVFGPEDSFFNKFGAMAGVAPVLPLIGGGHTRFQPVYAGDVGAAVVQVLAQPKAVGQTYELGGPGVYTFKALMELVLKETQRKRVLAPIPFEIAKVMGLGGDLFSILPFAPPVTSDQVELLRTDNVVGDKALGLAALGVTPTPLEASLPTYMWRFRKGGQFAQPEAANA